MKYLIVFLLACLLVSPVYAQEESVYCSCVKTARALGVDMPRVDATWYQSFKKQIPTVGGLALTSYKNADHISVIKGFSENGIMVEEGNYVRCEFTRRVIKFTDPALRGFWSPNY